MLLKEIPFKQNSLYGGFLYCLSNLLNNDISLNYVSLYKTRNLTDYHKNLIYHRISFQRERPLFFIQAKVNMPTYPFSLKNTIEKALFGFDFFSSELENQYKIYFVKVNLTKFRTHEVLVIKPLFTSNEIFIIDSMSETVIKTHTDYLFDNYYVMGYSVIEHKYNDFVSYTSEQLAHLIG